jgi:hypothetical protein
MEEILAEDVVDGCRADADPNAERHEEARNGCLSPRLSRLEEQLNAATLAIFSSTAATMVSCASQSFAFLDSELTLRRDRMRSSHPCLRLFC